MNSQHANLLQLFVGEIPFFFYPGFLYVPDPDFLGNPADLFHGQTQQISRSRLRYVLWNFITVLHEASPYCRNPGRAICFHSLSHGLNGSPRGTHTDTHQRGFHVLEFAAQINLRYRLHPVLHAFTIRGR